MVKLVTVADNMPTRDFGIASRNQTITFAIISSSEVSGRSIQQAGRRVCGAVKGQTRETSRKRVLCQKELSFLIVQLVDCRYQPWSVTGRKPHKLGQQALHGLGERGLGEQVGGDGGAAVRALHQHHSAHHVAQAVLEHGEARGAVHAALAVAHQHHPLARAPVQGLDFGQDAHGVVLHQAVPARSREHRQRPALVEVGHRLAQVARVELVEQPGHKQVGVLVRHQLGPGL
mmetsp:Transcript_43919/g.83873  ORF Transcript_43919/g.83873 Transcript_43919/m.83873 type:complete len:231 (-) Transcript_43919:502-1194(-)